MNIFSKKYSSHDYMTLDMAKRKQTLDGIKRRKKANQCWWWSVTGCVRRNIPQELRDACDSLIKQAWDDGSDHSFDALLDLISRNSCLINYKHSGHNVTQLVCAAARNKVQVVEALVCFGANPDLKVGNNMNAFDFAERFDRQEVCAYWLPFPVLYVRTRRSSA